MNETESGIARDSRVSQPAKAPDPTDVRVEGRRTDSRDMQPPKIPTGRETKPDSIDTFFRFWHPEKVDLPISEVVDKSVRLSRLVMKKL